MNPLVLDTPTDSPIALTPATQQDQGLQMQLFPTSHAAEVVEARLDLRVSDDLAGMYYIG